MEIIHTKYYKLRKKIMGASAFIIIALFFVGKLLLPDYLVKENELKSDSAIVQYAFINKYPVHNRAGSGYKNCLDLVLADKPYRIRFTDDIDSKYWEPIRKESIYPRCIQYKFQARLLQKYFLYNPNEVSIDNRMIIPPDSKKTVLAWGMFFFIMVAIVCGYYLLLLLKSYKQELYEDDRQTAMESKWKLMMVWLNE